jgi:hypothetical protein
MQAARLTEYREANRLQAVSTTQQMTAVAESPYNIIAS